MYRLSFGKYSGCLLGEVPRSYLAWLYRSSQTLVAEIERELGVEPPRKAGGAVPPAQAVPPGQAELDGVKDRLRSWHRQAVMRHHPDRSGDPAVMKQINLVWEDIRKVFNGKL